MSKKNRPNSIPDASEQSASKKPLPKSKVLLYFVLRFAVLFLVFEACYFNDYLFNHIFYPVNKFFAMATSKLLPLIGIHASYQAESISNKDFTISVKQGCDSIEALAIFIFGVLAFPSRWRIKLSGLLIGTFLILFMNLIRLIHLFWIGLNHRDLFDLFHLEIWQGYFILQSILLWIFWVWKASQLQKTN